MITFIIALLCLLIISKIVKVTFNLLQWLLLIGLCIWLIQFWWIFLLVSIIYLAYLFRKKQIKN